MSRTIRKMKKPKHGRVNFQMRQDEIDELDALDIGHEATRSLKCKLAVKKFVEMHKLNKKGVE